MFVLYMNFILSVLSMFSLQVEAGVQHQVATERYVHSYLTLHLCSITSLLTYGVT